jgi:AraC-like DNA-binding protein
MVSPATSDFESFRFSSDDLRPADRVPFYRDVIGQVVARFDKEPVGERFSCKAHFCRLPNLSISYVASTAVRANQTRAMTEGSSELILAAHLEGAGKVAQRSREASSIDGNSFLLVSTEHPLHVEHTEGRFVCIGMPRTMLAPMLSNPDAALMSPIPSTIEPLRLLTGYIDLLIKDPTLMRTAELRRLAVSHVHDLIALAVGATRDATEIAAGRGLRAARLRAIKADIAQNLAGDVTVAALSVRHRLSTRYVRKLFEGENTSLSQFVLGQRLTRVHRMLTDPCNAGRTIADIAFSVGFHDLSTFNREFRRRFGVTPSDVRFHTR